MADYIFLMHDDDPAGGAGQDWEPYLSRLREAGVFQGGSAIGDGPCERKSGATPAPTAHARLLLAGNPVFEAGGTVEIRDLPTR